MLAQGVRNFRRSSGLTGTLLYSLVHQCKLTAMTHHTAPLNDSALPHAQLINFFTDQLSCIYKAEKEFSLLLASFQSKAGLKELRGLISSHTLQTEKQV